MKKTKLLALVLALLLCLSTLMACDFGSSKEPNETTNETQKEDIKKPNGSTNSSETEDSSGEIKDCKHNLGSWVETKAPTCTESGEETRSCTKCSLFETREIAALGHTEVVDEAVEASCTESGLTNGKHCSVCGEILEKQETIAATGHKLGTWIQVQAPTCTEKGVSKAACRYCDYFETNEIEPKGHNEVIDYGYNATCTETGLTNGKHCSSCGLILEKRETVPATGHTYGEWVQSIAPTCTRKGEEKSTCNNCRDFKTREIEALGHSYSNGVCIRCKEVVEVDMLQRVSAPDGNENCFYIHQSSSYHSRWGVCWKAKNLSGKTIKYVKFTIEYYNKVYDVVYKTTYKITGPIAPGEMIVSDTWDTGALNFSLAYRGIKLSSDLGKIAITEIQLQYSDDSVEKGAYSFSSSEVK